MKQREVTIYTIGVLHFILVYAQCLYWSKCTKIYVNNHPFENKT